MTTKLRWANETLREVEDNLRDCERQADFGPGFAALARSVYRTNDGRVELKRETNALFGSRLVEESPMVRIDAGTPRGGRTQNAGPRYWFVTHLYRKRYKLAWQTRRSRSVFREIHVHPPNIVCFRRGQQLFLC